MGINPMCALTVVGSQESLSEAQTYHHSGRI